MSGSATDINPVNKSANLSQSEYMFGGPKKIASAIPKAQV